MNFPRILASLALACLFCVPAFGGTLAVVVQGKVTAYAGGEPIEAATPVWIRLYGGKQGEAKTLVDAAPTAEQLRFRRQSTSTATHCYEIETWIDMNADQQITPNELGPHGPEACGKFTDPPSTLRPGAPPPITIEAPAT